MIKGYAYLQFYHSNQYSLEDMYSLFLNIYFTFMSVLLHVCMCTICISDSTGGPEEHRVPYKRKLLLMVVREPNLDHLKEQQLEPSLQSMYTLILFN